MYSARIVERNVAAYERANGLTLIRYDTGKVDEWAAHLNGLATADGLFRRELRADEKAFIRNERVLTALDFRYWFERYVRAIVDQGGLDHVTPWASQRILLDRIAKLEEEMADQTARGEPVDGILICLHKARQLGATLVGRALTVHRLTTTQHTRAMAASLDDDKILELYDRDKVIIDNLPFWLRPSIGFDEKSQHIYFDKLGSRVIYQTSNQKFGVAQGRQFDLGHITECASWINSRTIEHDFFPTLPMSTRAMCLLESTAQRRGDWWHDFCTRCRLGKVARFHFVFIPWYAERAKYRAAVPADWQPSDVAMLHAKKVYETSAEFVGRAVMLEREQLYWWERTRSSYQSGNNLNVFLTNYCATPEESFQHSTRSAFATDVLDRLRLEASLKGAVMYDIAEGQAA